MKAFKFFFVIIMGLAFYHMNGQINLKGKVKDQASNLASNKVDQAVDHDLNAVENGMKGLFKNKKPKEESPEVIAGKNVKEEDKPDIQDGKPSSDSQAALQSYSKFDYIPGEKVIFYDDFKEASVGDFPASWNTNASGEVVTTNLYPGNWFKMIGKGSVALDEGVKLPDNYTIEFDVIPHASGKDFENFNFGFYLYSAANPKDLNEGGAVPGKVGIKMEFGSHSSYSAYNEGGYTMESTKEDAIMKVDTKYRLSFSIQKTRLRVYLDDAKIFDLPKIMTSGFQYNMVRFEVWDAGNPMVTNFRIATGLPDMRNKLLTEGKLVSYGIYFDVNKDVVKPESYGTLKEIANVLKENPAVRVKIIGHTDSDGAAAANLDLSKRRGASVMNEIVKNFGIEAARLESDGLGATKPIAPNDTPVNKALNRRVEFIKL